MNLSGNPAVVAQALAAQGYAPHQIAGFIGRLQRESYPELRPTAVGDNGTAYGMAQWRGPRYEALQGFAGERDWRDPNVQAQFIAHELDTSEAYAAEALRNAQSVDEAAAAAMHYFRPAGYSRSNPTAGDGYDQTLAYAANIAQQMGVEAGYMPQVQEASAPPPPSQGLTLTVNPRDQARPASDAAVSSLGGLFEQFADEDSKASKGASTLQAAFGGGNANTAHDDMLREFMQTQSSSGFADQQQMNLSQQGRALLSQVLGQRGVNRRTPYYRRNV